MDEEGEVAGTDSIRGSFSTDGGFISLAGGFSSGTLQGTGRLGSE